MDINLIVRKVFPALTRDSIESAPAFQSKDKLLANKKLYRSELTRLLDLVEKKNRPTSDEEEQAYEFVADILRRVEDEMDARTAKGDWTPKKSGWASLPEGIVGGTYRADGMAEIEPVPAYGIVHPTYGQLFHGRADYVPEPADVELFCRQIKAGSVEVRSMQTGVGADGGFTIPEFWEASIYQAVQAQSIALSRCRLFSMKSNILHIPAWDSEDGSRSDGVGRYFGGVVAAHLAEGAEAAMKSPKIRSIQLGAVKWGFFVTATREILEDSNSVAASLGPQLEMALTNTLDEHILVGSGLNEPLGVVNSDSAIKVGRATAGAVSFADIIGLRSRLHPSFSRNAIFIISPDVLGQLLQLEDTAGSYIFVPSMQGIAGDIPMTLLGSPLYVSDKIGPLGSTGDIILADFSQYALGMRQGFLLEKSEHFYFSSDQTVFRALVRFDGTPLMDSAMLPVNGSATTLSWAAILE